MAEARRCIQCGTELTADAREGLCPGCLLKLGFESHEGLTQISGQVEPNKDLSSRDRREREILPPESPTVSITLPQHPVTSSLPIGKPFGAYRILRLLGKGGMGEVYEAEHMESGRRVALKVLAQALGTKTDRERFLREGRLAASINHPNSVYIYGTEEITGIPVISMELLPAGTLKDRVKEKGILTPTEAVDVMLQVVSGLEAAETVGVLHRDIKPSNCFVDSDGSVKIGDFGLSISTLARQEETQLTAAGSFFGTPDFASPEQIQGDELDVRSDIYSVGASLYYLLTGRPPFDEPKLLKLVSRVLQEVPDSPSRLNPEIPKGLAGVVLRCLAKDRSSRCTSYAELKTELFPFSSTLPVPANLRIRFAAGLVDYLVCLMAAVTAHLYLQNVLNIPDPYLFIVSGLVLYFVFLEGIWGASLGKLLCGLRLIGPARNVPGLPRALLRALVFVLPIAMASRSESETHLGGGILVPIVLFLTARNRNGFAGLHDLISSTRVVLKSAYQVRPILASISEPPTTTPAARRIGPYAILESLRKTGSEELVLGYDSKLRRKVWIQVLPSGTPPLSDSRRDINRIGRLRWLNGKRAANECWDAYEAPGGRALIEILHEKQSWSFVRYWFVDLSEEILSGLENRVLPPSIGLDWIWITSDSRAKLLDFPAPGIGALQGVSHVPSFTVADFASVQGFLNHFAASALEGRIHFSEKRTSSVPEIPLPIRARSFLKDLGQRAFEKSDLLLSDLKSLIDQHPVIPRWRRFAHIACCGFLPTFAGSVLFIATNSSQVREQDLMRLQVCLYRLDTLLEPSHRGDMSNAREREALEIYIAGRFRETLSDPSFFTRDYPSVLTIRERLRKAAAQALESHPKPSDKEINDAAVELRPLLGIVGSLSWPFVIATIAFVITSILGVISSMLFHGGLLLHIFGIAVVSQDGSEVSSLRACWRGLLAWSPAVLFSIPFIKMTEGHLVGVKYISAMPWFALSMSALLIAGAIGSVVSPERGPQDRIAGTYLVPR